MLSNVSKWHLQIIHEMNDFSKYKIEEGETSTVFLIFLFTSAYTSSREIHTRIF